MNKSFKWKFLIEIQSRNPQLSTLLFSFPTAGFASWFQNPLVSCRFSLSSAPEPSAPPPLTGSQYSSGLVELQVSCALWLK
ncbi:hypothetical protein F2Q68_00011883 [Brassica cretica]|uniref:Uncharacterized protein n=1 Tax=Brassica cretica TaxID=69181 RepID=A0A8S9L164_BRACR|nr:hypothetical protein F2Q68_00011883 [Brassica cretica]